MEEPTNVEYKEIDGKLIVTFTLEEVPTEPFFAKFSYEQDFDVQDTIDIGAEIQKLKDMEKKLKLEIEETKKFKHPSLIEVNNLKELIKKQKAKIREMKNDEKILALKAEDEFEFFWATYSKPRVKGTKQKAKERWNKLQRKEKNYILDIIQDYALSNQNNEYKHNAENFLSKGTFKCIFKVFPVSFTLSEKHSVAKKTWGLKVGGKKQNTYQIMHGGYLTKMNRDTFMKRIEDYYCSYLLTLQEKHGIKS